MHCVDTSEVSFWVRHTKPLTTRLQVQLPARHSPQTLSDVWVPFSWTWDPVSHLQNKTQITRLKENLMGFFFVSCAKMRESVECWWGCNTTGVCGAGFNLLSQTLDQLTHETKWRFENQSECLCQMWWVSRCVSSVYYLSKSEKFQSTRLTLLTSNCFTPCLANWS